MLILITIHCENLHKQFQQINTDCVQIKGENIGFIILYEFSIIDACILNNTYFVIENEMVKIGYKNVTFYMLNSLTDFA